MTEEKRKYAQCGYASYGNSRLGLNLRGGDIILVTRKIEKDPSFQEGIKTGNFFYVEVETLPQLKKVVGVTDAIIKEFKEALAEETPEEEEPSKEEVTPDEKPEEKTDEEISEDLIDGINDVPPEGEDGAEEPKGEEPEGEAEGEKPAEEGAKEDAGDGEDELPEISFTRAAGNVEYAVKAVRNCEDLKLLKHAQEDDTRKTVQSALKIRIEELTKEE